MPRDDQVTLQKRHLETDRPPVAGAITGMSLYARLTARGSHLSNSNAPHRFSPPWTIEDNGACSSCATRTAERLPTSTTRTSPAGGWPLVCSRAMKLGVRGAVSALNKNSVEGKPCRVRIRSRTSQMRWKSDACRLASSILFSVTTSCGSCAMTTSEPDCWALFNTSATVANVEWLNSS